MNKISIETLGKVQIICINRPQVRNAVDVECANQLREAFVQFEQNPELNVAILTGAEGNFCAGADLKAVAAGEKRPVNAKDGPMGPTLLNLSKPTIAAVEGYAVAGGLELAVFCDLRVAGESAIFGVFCRRFGVPLVDGGTVRLMRIVGQGHGLDMILTGRPVGANEAKQMGLVQEITPDGKALEKAVEIAEKLANFPQECMRQDRASALEQWSLDLTSALVNEARHGQIAISSGESLKGAADFSKGRGRHGNFE
jgi:enoyl-CoA hydratase